MRLHRAQQLSALDLDRCLRTVLSSRIEAPLRSSDCVRVILSARGTPSGGKREHRGCAAAERDDHEVLGMRRREHRERSPRGTWRISPTATDATTRTR